MPARWRLRREGTRKECTIMTNSQNCVIFIYDSYLTCLEVVLVLALWHGARHERVHVTVINVEEGSTRLDVDTQRLLGGIVGEGAARAVEPNPDLLHQQDVHLEELAATATSTAVCKRVWCGNRSLLQLYSVPVLLGKVGDMLYNIKWLWWTYSIGTVTVNEPVFLKTLTGHSL